MGVAGGVVHGEEKELHLAVGGGAEETTRDDHSALGRDQASLLTTTDYINLRRSDPFWYLGGGERRLAGADVHAYGGPKVHFFFSARSISSLGTPNTFSRHLQYFLSGSGEKSLYFWATVPALFAAPLPMWRLAVTIDH